MNSITNAEVLDQAIETLQVEGSWCQSQYYKVSKLGQISYCAMGAIGKALGLWENAHLDPNGMFAWDTEEHIARNQSLTARMKGIAVMVATEVGFNNLHVFNDCENTTKEDVILAMKRAREKLT